MKVTPGSTDVTTYFSLRLAATGAEATGLTVTNFDLQYVRSGAAPAAKVDASALAATDSAHADNSAIEIDATDQPGLYRVDWPDAAFAAGVREVILSVKCATAFTEHLRVELETVQTGDSFARLGAPAGASVSADIAASKAVLGALNDAAVDGDPTTTDTLMQYVKQIVNTLVGSAGIPTFPAAAVPGDAVSLAEAIRQIYTEVAGLDGAAVLDAAGVRSAVGLASANLDTQLSGIQSDTNDLQTVLQGLVMASGTIGATGNDTTHVHLAGLTYGDDEINSCLLVLKDVSATEWHSRWIEDWADTGDLATVATLPFTPENSTDVYWLLSVRADVTGGSGLDAAGVRAALGMSSANLDTQLAAIDDAVDTEVAAVLAAVDTEVAAIKAKTDQLTFTATNVHSHTKAQDDLALTAQQKLDVNAEADTALADAGVTTTVTGRIDAAVTTRATPAQVNTEVLDVLTVDTFAQPGQEAPAATTTLALMLRYLYKTWRNKKDNDGAETKLYADNGTTVDHKQTTSSAGGTVTKGEWGTGA